VTGTHIYKVAIAYLNSQLFDYIREHIGILGLSWIELVLYSTSIFFFS